MRGCIQPMSSPMMKRMLGFCCCCAAAGILATNIAVSDANTLSQVFLIMVRSFSIKTSCQSAPSRNCALCKFSGRVMFQMLGVFAEFEREMIRERVNSGLDRVRGEIDRNGVYATKNGHTIRRLGR